LFNQRFILDTGPDPEADQGPQQTKKPVVKEKYEEIVFHEPEECFRKRVTAHKSKAAPAGEMTAVLGRPWQLLLATSSTRI